MDYTVKLEIFEGPLDLLLYLIKKNDLDIYDIPISQITAEYLAYIELIKMLNLEAVGEFLVMAATLMQIKVRMLLPRAPQDAEEEEKDPRVELVAKLLEYQKFKQTAKFLESRELEQQQIFSREEPIFGEDDYVLGASIFDLLEAFRLVIQEAEEEVKEIISEEIPLEEKIRYILECLKGKEYILFRQLFNLQEGRLSLIVTFLALLELVRLKQVIARQANPFGEIRIYFLEPNLSVDHDLSGE